jgi:hypothetical protein
VLSQSNLGMPNKQFTWVLVVAGAVAAAVVASVLWWVGHPPEPSGSPSRSTGRAPEVECPPVEGAYKPALSSEAGPSGTTVVAFGPMPVRAEGGRYVGPRSRKVELWWNLDPSRWESAVAFRLPSPDPRPGREGDASFLGRASTLGDCEFRIAFRVPDVEPGSYPVVALFYGRRSAAMFTPMRFRVDAD